MHRPLVVHTWLEGVVVEQGDKQPVVEVVVVVVVGVQHHNILGQQLGTEQGIRMLVQPGQLGQAMI